MLHQHRPEHHPWTYVVDDLYLVIYPLRMRADNGPRARFYLLLHSNPPALPTPPENPSLQEQEQTESPGSPPEHTAGKGDVTQSSVLEQSKCRKSKTEVRP